MTEQPPPRPASPVRNTAARAAQAGVNVIWLVPIIALVVTLAIAWNAYADRGAVIEVEFADATGVTPGETALRFREITVGQVDTVSFTADLSRVVVKIRVDKDVAPYIDADASFWIVRPQVTTQGVTRLDTVLTGAFIEGYWDATITEPQNHFMGQERPPLIREDTPGTVVRLAMDNADGITEGAPVLYRGVQVGRMENLRLSESEDQVMADAFIRAPHDKRLTTATVFWDTSGFSLSLGASGLSFDVNSLSSVLQGGVAFDTLVSGGQPVEAGHVFALQPDESTARNDILASDTSEPLRISMLISDSLRGLAKGADVQFQGLRVGQVTDLGVTVNGPEGEIRQVVTMAISPARLGLGSDATPEDALTFLQQAVDDGLRGRVASAGFLGTTLMVELVEIPDGEPASIDMAAIPNPVIPSVPGDLDDFSASAQGVLARIGDLPIEEVLQSATDMMNSITALASAPDTRAIPESLRETLDQTRNAATDIGGMARELREGGTAENVVRLVDEAAAAAEAVRLAAADAPQMIEQIDAAANAVEEFDFSEISAQAEGILADLRAMLGSEDAEQIPRNLSDTLQAASGLLTDLRDGNAAGSLNNALDSASTAADQVAESVQQLPQLIQRLETTAARADSVLASYGERSNFNNEAVAMLRELRRATEAFGSLARLIERNPRAFILGR